MKALLTLLAASALLMSSTIASAQSAPQVADPTPPAVSSAPVSVPAAPVAPSGVTTGSVIYTYHLGAGDKIRVSVFGEPDLAGTVAVTGDGKISLPLIGEVQAAGMTAPQLQSAIEAIYRQGYLKDPKVNVEVLNFRPFYILGEVKLPGEYPYDNGMTVVKAVAL
ncbi:MAG: polysaccharide biosynthesis/export family protein, partial [Asticcacaulis sp.]